MYKKNITLNPSLKNSIINDNDAVKIIETCFKDNNFSALINKVSYLFTDFQKEYRYDGYYYKENLDDPNKYPRDNYEIICHFVRYCFSQKNKYRLEQNGFNTAALDLLRQYFLNKYK